jgi:Tol biopolymer transport system component
VLDLETRELTNITQGRVHDESWLQWSPAGDRMIVFTAPGDWTLPSMSELYLLDLRSGNLREIVIDEWQVSAPVWSPDGTRIAYITGGDTLRLWSDMGEEWLRVDSDLAPFASWSPDGSRIFVPAADLPAESYVFDVSSEFGRIEPVELNFDDTRKGSGPPVWGPMTVALATSSS